MKKFAALSISCMSIFALLSASLPVHKAQAYFDLYPGTADTAHGSGLARFNTDPQDKPTLRVANHTQNPNVWFPSISGVRAGDIVSFDFYYHNTSNTNALDTRAAITFPNVSASNATGFSATGKIWAENASPVSGGTNVYLAEAVNDLSLSYQAAFWYPNQNSSSAQSLPYGQSGAEVITAQGVSLGTIAPGWASQGHLVVRFKVNGTPVTTTSSTNDAQCVSIDAPSTVTAGQTFTATIVVSNSGSKTWNSDTTPHRLGSQNPQDNVRWGLSRVNLAQTSVAPGQNATFTFTATAPTAAGTYPFDWKMVEESTEWFGATCAKNITVNAVQNDPDFTLSVSPGGTQTVNPPSQLSYTVYVDQVNGLSNPVSLSFISGASGISGTLNQASVWPGGYTQLFVTVSSGVPVGTYTSVVRGVMGNKTHDVNVTIYVNGASQPTLTISPSNVNIGVGGSVQFAAYYDPDGTGSQYSYEVTSQATWSSYNPQIAAPEATRGSFRGVAQGNSTIAASYAGFTATAGVAVNGSNGGSGNKPIVATKDATIIAKYSALLNGVVNPSGSETVVWFEYGTTAALGQESLAQVVGSGTGDLPMAYALLTLNPNTTYYFRAGAENIYGVSYGEILSFRTLPEAVVTSPPPAPAPTNTTVVVTTAAATSPCVKLIPSITAPEVDSNEEFDYYVIFRNECNFVLKDVVLEVTLPAEAELVSTNYPFTMVKANTLTYTLDTLEKNYQGTIAIRNILDREALRNREAKSVLYVATMNFKDAKGITQSVSAYLSVAVNTDGSLLLAALSSIFENLGWWWLWIVVLALIGYFIYRVWKRYKEGFGQVTFPPQFKG